MRLARVVVRLLPCDKQGLDRLRRRYYEETKKGISRAALIRLLVRRGLAGADNKAAAEALKASEIDGASMRSYPPKPTSHDDT